MHYKMLTIKCSYNCSMSQQFIFKAVKHQYEIIYLLDCWFLLCFILCYCNFISKINKIYFDFTLNVYNWHAEPSLSVLGLKVRHSPVNPNLAYRLIVNLKPERKLVNRKKLAFGYQKNYASHLLREEPLISYIKAHYL